MIVLFFPWKIIKLTIKNNKIELTISDNKIFS
jgi:hypothetical protein